MASSIIEAHVSSGLFRNGRNPVVIYLLPGIMRACAAQWCGDHLIAVAAQSSHVHIYAAAPDWAAFAVMYRTSSSFFLSFFNFHSFVQISALQFLYLLCDIHLINFKFRAFLCNLISGALFLSFHVLLICTLKCVMSLLIFLFQILWNTNEDSCCSGSMWNLHVAHVARTAWLHLGTPFFPNRSSIF